MFVMIFHQNSTINRRKPVRKIFVKERSILATPETILRHWNPGIKDIGSKGLSMQMRISGSFRIWSKGSKQTRHLRVEGRCGESSGLSYNVILPLCVVYIIPHKSVNS